MVKKKLIRAHHLSESTDFLNQIYDFIVYCIIANGSGTSRDSLFNSMNELS